MTTMTAVAPLVITGCGVVSPAGIGLPALAAAASGAEIGEPDLETIGGEFPPMPLAATPDLRVEEYLGRKGVRSLDRTTRLALVACNRALAGLGTPLAAHDRARTGVVIGTSTGSIRSSSEFSRDTLVQEKPYLVLANLFPNSVMNCCAGQIAIWNSLRGVNATIAGGRVSGLAAVRYARNAIAQGHVDSSARWRNCALSPPGPGTCPARSRRRQPLARGPPCLSWRHQTAPLRPGGRRWPNCSPARSARRARQAPAAALPSALSAPFGAAACPPRRSARSR